MISCDMLVRNCNVTVPQIFCSVDLANPSKNTIAFACGKLRLINNIWLISLANYIKHNPKSDIRVLHKLATPARHQVKTA